MTDQARHTAELRMRGATRVRVQWPEEPGPATALLTFGVDCVPCVPGLLVLGASCADADDAIRMAEWCADHSAELGAHPDRLLVTGVGTAARLAAAVALHARDRGWPVVVAQVLVAPRLTPTADSGPYAAPLRARSLAGVASATVVGTPADDGHGYAERLRRAGVAVDEITISALGPRELAAAIRAAVIRSTERNR